MNRFPFTNTVGLVLLLSPVVFSQVPAVDAIAEKEIESGSIVGMTIGVARDREILHLKGYGIADIENSVPATDKTVYRIGSITKMFTAVAILQLLEGDKLKLDDPLTKYLPDYPDPENQIRIRHLLDHTSGIANVTVMNTESYRLMTTPSQLSDGTRIRYGLGCFVEKRNGYTLIRHGGGIAGFVSELAYQSESKISVVILTNTGKNLARGIADEVMKSVSSENRGRQ